MPDQESVSFDIDPRSVLGAIKQMNSAMEGYEKGSTSANANLQKAIERTSDLLLKVNDRSRTSMERLTQSIEKQAAAYGKTNAERMVAERDRIIKKLGDEKGMIDRVNESYAKMLAADAAGQGAAGIESMGYAAQQSKASLALMGEEIGIHIPRQLRTFITMLPGVGQALDVSFKAVAIIALIAVIYEAVKKVLEFRKALDDLHTAAEKNAAEFDRFADSQKLANLELKTTNDQLENAIAKLQHKPENNLKIAVDEAATAALNLSERMDKSLRSFAELAQKNAPGMFAEILGRQQGTKDITELIQGERYVNPIL
jgi:cell division protein FtsB